MEDNQAIVFAFYRGNNLMGYRQDTVGSIGNQPKIYTYSKDQVETCLKNIRYNIENPEGIGEALRKYAGDSPEVEAISKAEKETYNTLEESRAFEVRVLKAPSHRKEFDVKTAEWKVNYFDYPYEELAVWLQTPENHEVIETHYFSFDRQLNLQ